VREALDVYRNVLAHTVEIAGSTTFNHRVPGSSPGRLTNKIKGLAELPDNTKES